MVPQAALPRKCLLLVSLLLCTTLCCGSTKVGRADEKTAKRKRKATKDKKPSQSGNECGLYLAESSVKNAGWGVFAGKDFRVGDRVEPPGLGIQVIDMDDSTIPRFLSEVLWRSGTVGGFSEARKVSTLLPGIGSLANYYPPLANVQESGLDYNPIFDDAKPQGGSITAYHNFSFVAEKKIKAGDEIFLGHLDLYREAKWRTFPTADDYSRAQEIVDGLSQYRRKFPQQGQAHWIDLLYRIKTEMLGSGNETVASLLPETLEDVTEMEEEKFEKAILTKRSLEWIKKNGYCLDNIKEGISTTPNAGRGAFATRKMKQGDVVVPAPLIPIMKSSKFDMSGYSASKTQLLENYCFGHKSSEARFCPLTRVTLMNHKEEANAKLRWGKTSTNREFVKNPLLGDMEQFTQLGEESGPMLSPLTLEVVALRDIAAGEEIYLDYGKLWQDAYDSHVNDWTAVGVSRKGHGEEEDIAGWKSHTHECRLEPMTLKQDNAVGEESYSARPYQDPANWDVHTTLVFQHNRQMMWFPCEIKKQNPDGETYRAVVYSKNMEPMRVVRIFTDIRKGEFRSAVPAYTSEQHLARSFRHYIPLPDWIFPFRWRSDYLTASELDLGCVETGIDGSLAENRQVLVDHEDALREVKCGVYFAPSNIPEAGFSAYTAVPYVGRGISIGSSMATVLIPHIFPGTERWNGIDYVWNSMSYKAEFEIFGNQTSEVLSLSLANYHPGIINMGVQKPNYIPTLDRCEDPGAGAFSDYVGASFISNHKIKAGEELFVSYGDHWFRDRPEFGEMALSDNYKEANRLMASLSAAVAMSDLTDSAVQELIDVVRTRVVATTRTKNALTSIKTRADLVNILSRNGTAQSQMEIRSLEWLEENGQCTDHIYLKHSTIMQAGRGAFTRRFLVKGTNIISSPLITTWGRHMMTMNSSETPSGVNPTQLLMNYQLGHPNSSVLFLPINPLVGINHMSSRMPNGSPPNAELRWSEWDKKSHYYLQRPLEDLKEELFSTMVLDVVATRDISADEEIFIDYGEAWEKAWLAHVKNFKKGCKGNEMSSLAISRLNHDVFNPKNYKWNDQHFTVCERRRSAPHREILLVEKTDRRRSDSRVMQSFGDIDFGHEGFALAVKDTHFRSPCVILEANSQQQTFQVALFMSEFEDTPIPEVRKLLLRDNVPATDVEIVPKPWTSDMHHSDAFRHEIKIPDAIFPKHWMDLIDE